MQIERTLARLVRLSFGLSRYFRLSESLSESLSQKVKSSNVFVMSFFSRRLCGLRMLGMTHTYDSVGGLGYCSDGGPQTPAHHCSDFSFKTYAPVAFQYFRELFDIRSDDYMV